MATTLNTETQQHSQAGDQRTTRKKTQRHSTVETYQPYPPGEAPWGLATPLWRKGHWYCSEPEADKERALRHQWRDWAGSASEEEEEAGAWLNDSWSDGDPDSEGQWSWYPKAEGDW
eukprot:807832-Rhodomonas_salina.1